MKKKLLIAVLMLSIVGFVQFLDAANACHKTAELVSTGDGDMLVEVGEESVWLTTIYLINDQGAPMTDVVVKDNLGGELEIDSFVWISKGDVTLITKGATNKIQLTWNVGDLALGEMAWLVFYVSTDTNPAGKQEYTSPGDYWLNSGPTMKYKIYGVQGSLEMPPIPVTVLPPN
jgi:hypothetical protein